MGDGFIHISGCIISQNLEREILERNLILSLGKVEALHIGTINGLVALIGQRNVNRILMQMAQNVGVKLLASVLISGDQDLGDGFVNLGFIIQAKLGCIVTVYRRAHGCQRGLRIIRSAPADVEYHIEITGLHVIAVGLLLLAVDV